VNCVDGNVVERVSVYKLLGVIVDDTLKWKSHVNSICAEASRRLHFLNILKRSSFRLVIYPVFILLQFAQCLNMHALCGTIFWPMSSANK